MSPSSAFPTVRLVPFVMRLNSGVVHGQSQPHIAGQSKTRPSTGQSTSGISPVIKVEFNHMDARGLVSMVSFATEYGNVPVKSFPCSQRNSSPANCAISVGIEPDIAELPTRN